MRNICIKWHLLSLLLIICAASAAAPKQNSGMNIDSILKVLDLEIEQRDTYASQKEQKLRFLKETLAQTKDMRQQFTICENLFNEYKHYQYDSAYVYALRTLETAEKIKDNSSVAWGKCHLLYCYISVGFFEEAEEVMSGFSIEGLTPEELHEYYSTCVYFYQNLIAFAMGTGKLMQKYQEEKQKYYGLTLKNGALLTDDGYRTQAEDMLHINEVSIEENIEQRIQLLSKYDLSLHEQAVQYCILSENSDALDKREEAIYYAALSAIADIRSNTRETLATKLLASYMYDRKDMDRALRYIRVAQKDANFYNTNLRKIEINTLLPIIENERYNAANRQRIIILSITVLTILSVVLLTIVVISTRKRNRNLQEARKKIATAYEEIEQQTQQLNEANNTLSTVNHKLQEANEIKDQYIVQSLYSNSDFVNLVEEKCKLFERKLKAKQYTDLPSMLTSMGIKQERERMASTFDQAFLKLFPNFLDEYNRLFPIERHIKLGSNGVLPTEVRIFALMRLGIEDNNLIASYLNLSLNTIYVYKSKVKAKAIVPQDDFDRYIMQIPKP